MTEAARVTTERLLAVERALHGARVTDEIDILLDSIVVALSAEGPMPSSTLASHVCQLWPGTRLDPDRVLRAAEAGVTARVLVHQPALDGQPGYALLAGADPNNLLEGRVENVLSRTKVAVQHRFRVELGRDLDEEESTRLTTILIDAVSAGIRDAFEVYAGGVHLLSTEWLVPDRWSEDSITAYLDAAGLDAGTRATMGALALSALDPSSRFGSDIVTQIATGYVLYAFLARRDQAKDVADVGSLAGTRLYLDTPLLLTLSGRTPARDSLLKTLRVAKDARLALVIPEQCIGELNRLLDGIEHSGSVDAFRQAIAEGDDPYVLAQTVDSEPLEAWLSHSSPDRSMTWEEYRRYVNDLPQRLAQLGFNRVALPDVEEARAVARRCTDHMLAVLRTRPRAGQGQGGPNIDAARDDGSTMAMAAITREQQHRTRFWPDAWVLTPDRRMADAYREFNPDDEFPLTLTTAQLAALLSTFVTPASAADLAAAAATLVSQETVLKVAVRYPPNVAVKIAHTLRGDGLDAEVDVRLTQQTSIYDLLGDEPLAPDLIPDHIGAVVADRRARRREILAALERDGALRARDEAQRARELAEAEREAELQATRKAHAEETRRMRDAESRLQERLHDSDQRLRDRQRHADELLSQERTKFRRAVLLLVALVVAAVGVSLVTWSSLDPLGWGTVLSAALLLLIGWDEVKNDDISWARLGRSLFGELVALLEFLD